MKLGYDNLEDARSKLLGTYCMYKGSAIVVKEVQAAPDAADMYQAMGVFMSSGRSTGVFDLEDKLFNCSDYNIGYLNKNASAPWFYRIPLKQYKQGLRYDQVSARCSNPYENDFNFKPSKLLAQMMENSYPTYKDAVGSVISGERNISPFHKNFALTFDRIHDDCVVEYKAEKIGLISKSNEIKLMSKFSHLEDALREAMVA